MFPQGDKRRSSDKAVEPSALKGGAGMNNRRRRWTAPAIVPMAAARDFSAEHEPVLEREIAAYDAVHGELERKHSGKFVVFRADKLVGIFDSFEAAAGEAIRRFSRGPYLIREVGASVALLPVSITLRQATGDADR